VELESLSDGLPRPAPKIGHTLLVLLAISVIIQVLVGIGLLTGILISAYWLSKSIDKFDLRAFTEIVQHLLATSISIDQLSHEARHVVRGIFSAVNESTVALESLNRVLKHPTVSLTLPGLGNGA
jgi:hypothetical protein